MPRSSRSKLLLLSLIPLGILAAGSLAALRPSDDPGTIVEISGRMPELRGQALGGGEVTPDMYRGKVVLVNFWATWCGPCRKEQPALQRLSEELAGEVQFLGVNYKDDVAAAREYLREFGVTYPSLEDDDGRIGYEFGIPYLPATILVDRTGEMRYRLLGAQTESSIREHVEELLEP